MESKQQQPQKLQQIEKIVCVPNEFYDEIDHIPILKEPNLMLEDFLFLGNGTVAKNIPLLQSHNISYILNVAGKSVETGADFYPDRFRYHEIKAEDEEGYPILDHFEEVFQFLEEAKKEGKRAYIHCAAGMNRSGALCVAYCMVAQNWELVESVRHCFERRPVILTNRSFREQLVAFEEKRLNKD